MSAAPGSERRTAPVELLWDLVFVFAVTQVSTLLREHLSWGGFGRALLALALMWWAWSAFVWATNAEHPDAVALRATLFVATLLIFLTGLALPHAFGRDGTLFAATYTGVRLLHLALYADASRRGNASWSAIAGFGVTVLAGMGLLVVGSFANGGVRVALWAVAAAIDYAGPAWLTRERLRGLQQVAVAHFAERYGLFVIICLGESIVAVGFGAGARHLGAELVGAAALALLVTIGLWWTYFDRASARGEQSLRAHDDPVLAAADAYSYLHLPIVAGIIVFAVGARAAVAGETGALPDGARLALYGGVALYLLAHAAFTLRLGGARSVAKLLAAIACMALFALTGGLVAWAAVGLLALLLAALAGVERLTPLRSAPEPRAA